MLHFFKQLFYAPFAALIQPGQIQPKDISRRWFMLSIGALMLAGLLSLSFIIGRAPVISRWITDPHWIKRVLVVHVDLALLVFIYSFFCGLFTLIPGSPNSNRLLPFAFSLSLVGVVLLILTIFVSSAAPVLSNYIPVLDHPLFITSLIVFSAGVALTVLNPRIVHYPHTPENDTTPHPLPASSVPGLQSAALLLLLSLITFYIAWQGTPSTLNIQTYYEWVIWGGGHLLQFVNMATMVAVWLLLLGKLLKRNPLAYTWSAFLFALFTLPLLAAPLLAIKGISSSLYIVGFTRYMQWGIFPVVTIFIIITLVLLRRAKNRGELLPKLWGNPYFVGLILSITFIAIGFVLGGMIRGSNTLIPAHYHAALGGITVAFMVGTYLMLNVFGMKLPARLTKKAALQPLIFGVGQALFVVGFAYAGAYGLARKSFGAEQHIGSVQAYIGLAVAGVGGLLAIAGGLLFFWIVIKAWRSRSKTAG